MTLPTDSGFHLDGVQSGGKSEDTGGENHASVFK